uniref:NosR/NirI family protein n=1 Tax=Marinobacterium profundum TaxID=1714300 RepID=UPI00082D1415|nr:NosR/NirI family protein [Marinobacterium profundum]
MTLNFLAGRTILRGLLPGLLLLLASCILPASQASAALTPQIEAGIQSLFPKLTRIGEPEQNPAVIPVYQLNELLGYAFETNDLTNLAGFSGDRINLLVGLDTKGTISGLMVLNHHEPIFLHGLGEEPMHSFVSQYAGRKISDRIIIDSRYGGTEDNQSGTVFFDGVTKATVSVLVINDTILSAALKVARAKLEGFAQSAPARARADHYQPLSWQELLSLGLVKRWKLLVDDVNTELPQPVESYPQVMQEANPEDLKAGVFADIYSAYLNAPSIGRNILGEDDYQRLLQTLRPGEHAIMVASSGPFPFLEADFRRGTVPQRIALTQNGLPVDIRDLDFYDETSAFSPDQNTAFTQARIFRIKAQSGFDPSQPLELRLNLELARNHLIRDNASFGDSYQLPSELFETIEVTETLSPEPLWVRLWKSRIAEILLLSVALVIVTLIFVFQHRISHQSQLFHRLRWGVMLFTLFVLGIYSQGQLSVVNIFTLLLSLLDGFDIAVFLLDPILFVLWTYIFVTLFLWGRGVFCGWLCPFGVMQEITSKLASLLKIKQVKVAPQVHRWLQKLKYLLLVILVAVSFYSLSLAERLAELEPFKTSVTLLFVRSWPFVLYALLLLATSLFIHKFFCRYLCPLGAGLAILGRFSLFKWLHRRKECGSPCQLCKVRCEIDSINRDGSIDYDECVQCMECIVILNNGDQCAIELSTQKKQRKAQAYNATDATLIARG